MYAVAIIRYRAPMERVVEVTEAHRAYQRELEAKGVLLASGPHSPRYGGMMLLRIPDGDDAVARLDEIRDGDPFVKEKVAQYEILCWAPVLGKERLDRL